MTEVVVRYSCDGCYKWTDDPDKYHRVEIRPFNSRGDLPGRMDLYCDECFDEREKSTRKRGRMSYADLDVENRELDAL